MYKGGFTYLYYERIYIDIGQQTALNCNIGDNMKKNYVKKDLMQDVTNRIIEQLESGSVPWVKPWKGDGGYRGESCLPKNLITGKAYRGINRLILWGASESNYFLTYRQAKLKGGNVKKGAKGHAIAFYSPIKIEDKTKKGEFTVIPLMKSYTVFTVEDCEGIELPPVVEAPKTPIETRHAKADNCLKPADIRHGGDSAYYSPSHDHIQLPVQAAFKTPADYYATALHELTHWTSHKTRCDRNLVGRFGDTAYAREELCAELGAAFLCADLGIEGKLQHAAYIESWLKVLKGDKKAIFTAAGQAQKAVDFIQGVEVAKEEKEATAATA